MVSKVCILAALMTIIAATWAATAESKTQDLDTQASAHFVPTSYATGYAGYPAYAAGYASYGAGYAGQGYAAGHNYATGLSHGVGYPKLGLGHHGYGGFYGYPAAGYYGYPVGGFGYTGYKHAAFDHGKFALHG